MQVCAPHVVLKPPYLAIRSAMIAEVTLSICVPPYSSGTSTPLRPSSPAFFSSSRLMRNSFCSSFSILGTISLVANSSAVCAINWCCSVKSSGVKMSFGLRSSIRKLPPGSIFVGIEVTVAIFHLDGTSMFLSSRDRALLRGPIFLFQFTLQDFSGPRFRETRNEFDRTRTFVVRELRPAKGYDFVFGCVDSRSQHDERPGNFAPFCIRDRHNGRFVNCW